METSLTEHIKTKEFDYFQHSIFLDNQFDDFIGDLGDKFDCIGALEDVFLLQKVLYEELEVYVIFPIVARFIYEKATRWDCQWCWNSKVDINDKVKEDFMLYLLDLINTYENQN